MTRHDTTTEDGRSRERYRRATLSAASSASAKGIALLTTAVSVPLTLGYLGSERFGVWMTLSAVIALLGFSDLGIGNSLMNGVAHAAGRDDRAGIRATLSSGLAMLSTVAVVVGITFAAAYGHIPWPRVFNVASGSALAEVGPAAAVLVACFLLSMPAGVFQQVRFGLQQGYVNSIFVALGNVGGLVLVVVAIQLRLGLPWLVLAMAGAPLVATVLNGLTLMARSPWLRPARHEVRPVVARSLLRVGLMFLILQLAVAIAFTSNSVIIAAMIGPTAVAEYAVVSKLFLIPALMVSLALGPLWPAYREALSRGDAPWVRRTFRRSILLSLTVGGSVSAALIVLGLPLITIWVGSSVTPSFGLVLAVGIWTTLSAVGTAVAMLLNGAQIMRFQVVAAIVMAMANVLLSIALTSRLGVAGPVWGSIVAYSLFSLIPVALYLPRVLARIDRTHAPTELP
ncbi:MAG: oligosaccharide flippase family protein [Chloroflexi bacterium]|nr:oligosaccharide flippase family protein [Chloroflexota bacterium]